MRPLSQANVGLKVKGKVKVVHLNRCKLSPAGPHPVGVGGESGIEPEDGEPHQTGQPTTSITLSVPVDSNAHSVQIAAPSEESVVTGTSERHVVPEIAESVPPRTST